jgi:hypothetical protein
MLLHEFFPWAIVQGRRHTLSDVGQDEVLPQMDSLEAHYRRSSSLLASDQQWRSCRIGMRMKPCDGVHVRASRAEHNRHAFPVGLRRGVADAVNLDPTVIQQCNDPAGIGQLHGRLDGDLERGPLR